NTARRGSKGACRRMESETKVRKRRSHGHNKPRSPFAVVNAWKKRSSMRATETRGREMRVARVKRRRGSTRYRIKERPRRETRNDLADVGERKRERERARRE
ncbi:hypothetical protein X777_01653, partial [Ooceraea biroi]